ncbi:MAG: CARDB domain-containing protein [Bacteroidales bacterium]
MKNYLFLFLILCMPGALSAQATEFSLDSVYAIPGDSVVIPVKVKSLQNAGSATIYVGYDGGALTFGRALDWHPSLQGSIYMASAVNNVVAIVWADINGASISDDVFVHLKFRFNGGSSNLEFTPSSEVSDIWGNPLDPAPIFTNGFIEQTLNVTATAQPDAICLGNSSQLGMQIFGGLGTVSYYWYSDPPGFTSTLANPIVSPEVTTSYHIIAYDAEDTADASVTVTVFPLTPPDPVDNMQPVNNAVNQVRPLNFSWGPAGNANNYRLHIWEAGNQGNGLIISTNTETHYELQYFLQPGITYEWKVVSRNPCVETDGPVQQFTMALLPDLIVENVQVPPTAFSGQTIQLAFIIANQGAGSTAGNTWQDLVYLSEDSILITGFDYYLGTFPNLSSLDPGESYTRTFSTALPQGISGNYFVFIKTGNNITYPESTGSNNISRNQLPMAVSLSPTPDLQVSQIQIPENAFSGQNLPITWTVSNDGDAPTSQTIWRDRIFFSADTFFTASSTFIGTFMHTGILAAGESYTETRTFIIPPNIFGTFYIYIQTDFFNQVYEHALENNNVTRSQPLNVFLTPPADLVPTQLNVPGIASNREIIAVNYTIVNDGANSANVSGGWADTIYISNSPILNTTEARKIGSYQRTVPLAAGESYTRSINCQIPLGLSGQHYIHVFTDANLRIFEFDMEENNILTSQPFTILNPDLVVSDIILPDTAGSGSEIEVSYYQKNNGPGLMPAGLFFRDSLLISTSPVYDSALMTGFNIKYFNGIAIPAGDSLLRSYTVRLPHGLNGDYYLYVHADKRNNVTEGPGENNNISRSALPVHINLTPWPDLVVESITLPEDTLFAGTALDFAYSVKNAGPGGTVSPLWKDLVCISSSPFGPSPLILPKTVNISSALDTNGIYQKNMNLSLPNNLAPGPYFVYVLTDSTDLVYENTGEGNNLMRSDPFWVEAASPTNLAMLSLSGPDTVNSGYPMNILWTVKNLSPSVSFAGAWVDMVYLSDDLSYEPDEDLFVGALEFGTSLAGGASYTRNINFRAPSGISGDYFLIAVADKEDQNNDINFSNNVKIRSDEAGNPVPLHVNFVPAPDLEVTVFNAPSTAVAGQDITVNVTVTNVGPGSAYPLAWTDRLFLSGNPVFDPNDIYLGAKGHTSGLQTDVSYSFSLSARIPNTAVGNYILLLVSDGLNQVYEGGSETNNIASHLIQITMPPPVDLIVENIIPPADLEAGLTTTVEWTIRNQSNNPAGGKMRDLVYFSKDSLWDPSDILFGSLESTINLAAGNSLNRNLSGKIMDVTPGPWYVIVRTNVINSIIETNYDNNEGYSDETFRVTVPLLALGVWTDDSLSNSQPLYYQIDIPDSLIGETLRVQLKGDSVTGNNEFYIRYNEVPSRSVFDVGFSDPGRGNQELLVPYLLDGSYYLLIYGNTLTGTSQNIRIHAGILPFTILSVNADQGGNTGEITLKMTGSKFTPDMQVFLNQGDNKISATSLLFDNTTRVYPTFNLNEAPTGIYNLGASKSCEGLAVLPDAFEVVEGEGGDLQLNLVAPAAIGPNGIAPVRVEFVNSGKNDLLNPSGTAVNLIGGPVSRLVNELPLAPSELQLIFEENGGPQGILRPGAKGSFTIFSRGNGGASGNILGIYKN